MFMSFFYLKISRVAQSGEGRNEGGGVRSQLKWAATDIHVSLSCHLLPRRGCVSRKPDGKQRWNSVSDLPRCDMGHPDSCLTGLAKTHIPCMNSLLFQWFFFIIYFQRHLESSFVCSCQLAILSSACLSDVINCANLELGITSTTWVASCFSLMSSVKTFTPSSLRAHLPLLCVVSSEGLQK